MIATITQQDAATELVANYLNTIKNQGFTGDTDASYATRLTASTDNSIYQQLPQGVIFPKSEKDIQVALQIASQDPFLSLTFGLVEFNGIISYPPSLSPVFLHLDIISLIFC